MSTTSGWPDSTRILSWRYIVSFGVVASLLVLNQILVQPQLLGLNFDAPTINRAGRQRMLSQRLAKASLMAARAKTDVERRKSLDELEDIRTVWAETHRRLNAEARDSTSGRAIRSGLDEVEPYFTRLQDASRQLTHASTPEDREAALAELLRDESPYLRTMDRLVGIYESEARARVDRLLWTGRALTALSLAALAGLGLFVLRPAVAIIRRQVDDLRIARDDLEAKVKERTRELEIESERRADAEARHRSVLEIASQASRINTLGEMASSLAHELNQPLGAIANYAEGCQVELGRDVPHLDEVREAIRKLLANTMRAGEVIKRVRRFVTRRGLDYERVDPGRIVAEVADLMNDDAQRRGITLRVNAVSDLPNVWGDPVQIQQVLINLVRNALESVDASQTSTRTVNMVAECSTRGTIEFRVTDDGEGISEADLGRVFDPFFSTRAEGMGMGLAISRTMVEAHQGILEVESLVGAGTTFRFKLPAMDADDERGRHGLRR